MKTSGSKVLHLNQKPLSLMERIVGATSDPGDVVWEPFGGLCSAAVASIRLGRRCYSAEILPEFHRQATARLDRERELLSWEDLTWSFRRTAGAATGAGSG